jgi:hypothetical protein
MMRLLRPLWKAAQRFKRDEAGNSTIEFVMMIPIAFSITFATYESGMLSTRQVMLERGVDVVVRRVRIGALRGPTHDILKKEICAEARIIPDCLNQIRVDMLERDIRNWVDVPARAECVDRAADPELDIHISQGGNNRLMVLRVCALFDPVLPLSTIGEALPKRSGAAYGLVATSSFVMEPYQ